MTVTGVRKCQAELIGVLLILIGAMSGLYEAGANAATSGGSASSTPAAKCPAAELVGIRGSGETANQYGGFGYTVNSVITAVQSAYSGTQSYAVNYQAIGIGYSDQDYGSSYRNSERSGVLATETFLEIFHARCPGTPIELIGFSQGAQAAGDVFQAESKAIRKQIVGLVLFGDPRFNPSQSGVDFGSYDHSQHGVWSVVPKLGGTLRKFSSSQVQYVHSYCLKFDPVCNWSLSNGINCLPGLYCVHLHYADFGYTDLAAKWLISRLPPKHAPLEILDYSLPGATVSSPYAARLYGIGGRLPYTWAAAGTLLSDGITFDPATAALAGKPARAGQFSLEVTLRDGAAQHVSRSYTVYVTPVPAASPDWSMAAYGPGQSYDNTGESALGPANAGQLAELWARPDTDGIRGSLEYDDVVYSVDAPSGADVLVARSLGDGSTIWSKPLGQYATGSQLQAIGDGVIVINVSTYPYRTYTLVGLSIKSGSQLWSDTWLETSSLVIDRNELIGAAYGEYSGYFFGALDVASGAVIWSEDSPAVDPTLFAVSDGIIVALGIENPGANRKLYLEGLSEVNGHVIWSQPSTASEYWGFGPIEANGAVFIDLSPITNVLEYRDLKTGALIWRTPSYEVDVGDYWSAEATDGHSIYAATEAGNAFTIRAFQNGRQTWSSRLPAGYYPYNLIIANGLVYVDAQNPGLTTFVEVLASASGRPLWKSPAVTVDWGTALWVARGCLMANRTLFTVT